MRTRRRWRFSLQFSGIDGVRDRCFLCRDEEWAGGESEDGHEHQGREESIAGLRGRNPRTPLCSRLMFTDHRQGGGCIQ
jgi:hypothetical protein